MSRLDRDLLDAFLPEFEAEAARLATAGEAAQAARAFGQLRAMAAALGAPSLVLLLERAAPALDPPDLAALAAAAEGLARQARAIGAAGADVALPEPAPPAAPPAPGPAPAPPAPPAPPESGPALDPELLAAFLPDFAAGCARLAAATDPAAARRAADGLSAMAAALDLGSLRAMLEAAPLDPFDAAALPPLAAALARRAEAIAAAGRDLPAGPAAAPRRRVLVVDDSPMMRRLVREIVAADPDLETVGEAPDGRAALAAIAALQPDLVLLDIEMPELDGIGVLRHWALRGGPAVVVVSSAARPGSATAIELRRLGAAGIVGKPSGALSPDLRERQGETLRRLARRALGLPEAAA